MNSLDDIEDRRDDPINRDFRPESTRHADIREECAELRYRLRSHGTTLVEAEAPMRTAGPCARAVARAKARMEGDPSEEMFNGADSAWGAVA